LYLPGEQITLNTATGATTGIRYFDLPGGGTAYRTGTGINYGYETDDQQGTSLLSLSYTAQSPTWRQQTPYGAPRGTTATWIDNHAFLDKPADPATGLDIVGARSYDPGIGRFTSPDPVLEQDSPLELNGYSYAAANPITNSDPDGLCAKALPDEPPIHCDHTPVPVYNRHAGTGAGGGHYIPYQPVPSGNGSHRGGCFRGLGSGCPHHDSHQSSGGFLRSFAHYFDVARHGTLHYYDVANDFTNWGLDHIYLQVSACLLGCISLTAQGKQPDLLGKYPGIH
jgi:RHS repeat-associated protein